LKRLRRLGERIDVIDMHESLLWHRLSRADRPRALKRGETLAVLGAAAASGGAVELGKLMVRRVIACASATRSAFARAHGATRS